MRIPDGRAITPIKPRAKATWSLCRPTIRRGWRARRRPLAAVTPSSAAIMNPHLQDGAGHRRLTGEARVSHTVHIRRWLGQDGTPSPAPRSDTDLPSGKILPPGRTREPPAGQNRSFQTAMALPARYGLRRYSAGPAAGSGTHGP